MIPFKSATSSRSLVRPSKVAVRGLHASKVWAERRTLQPLRAAFFRGGTSNAVMLLEEDLPSNRQDWPSIFLSIMGSPDPNGRQLDGMGGGLSSLSKICLVKKSQRKDADVDFTFVQIGIKDSSVDLASNCGNMTAAIGPFAVEHGILYKADEDGNATVRIHNTNTKKIIHSTFPLLETGLPDYDGDFAIDGVADTAARIKLDFISPGGSKTGKLLPTSNPVDLIDDIPEVGQIAASLVDCANPCVFVRAKDLGVDATLLPDAIQSHPKLMRQLETVRRKASVMMGMTATEEDAARMTSVPKVCFVSAIAPHTLLSGERVEDTSQADILVRTISTGDPHRAIPITVGLCVAAAANIPGSIVQTTLKNGQRADPEGIVIAHPSGRITVGAETRIDEDGKAHIDAGTMYRTCRKLFEGSVFYRA